MKEKNEELAKDIVQEQKDIVAMEEKRYDDTLAKVKEHFKKKTVVIKADHEIDNQSIGFYEYAGAKCYDHQPDYVNGWADFIFPEVYDESDMLTLVDENMDCFTDDLYGEDKDDIEVEVFIKDGKTTVSIGYTAEPVESEPDYDEPDYDRDDDYRGPRY